MEAGNQRYKAKQTILLTGAGFTHSFGGYLASQMWSEILNQPEIKRRQDLRVKVLDQTNYETLYDDVLYSGNYKPDRHELLTTAIRNVYEQMHHEILRQEPDHENKAFGVMKYFVNQFAGSGDELGFFFTLNQDLFVENFYRGLGEPIKLPGITTSKWYNKRFGPKVEKQNQIQLGDKDSVKKEEGEFWKALPSRFVYIKLHGSYGWIGHDGSDAMVIGHTKTRIIEKEPLLKFYLSLFKRVLNEGDRNLVVIGYGFRDDHINKILADAVDSKGLRLHVVLPTEARHFRTDVLDTLPPWCGQSIGDRLWKGLCSYHQSKATDFYHGDKPHLSSDAGLTPRGQRFFRIVGLI